MSLDWSRGMAAAPWKVTALGPNQASYSMTTRWELVSTINGPVGVWEEARLDIMRMARSSGTVFVAGVLRIHHDNPVFREKFRLRGLVQVRGTGQPVPFGFAQGRLSARRASE